MINFVVALDRHTSLANEVVNLKFEPPLINLLVACCSVIRTSVESIEKRDSYSAISNILSTHERKLMSANH